MKNNPVCYWELASHNAEESMNFLKNVFGWEANYDDKMGMYDIPISKEANFFSGGGVFTLKKAKLPFLTIYIMVDDIFEKAKLIKKYGGYIIEEPHSVQNGPTICLFNEPSGVTLAMIQLSKSNEIE